MRRGHNRGESLVERLHIAEQFDNPLARASRSPVHLLPQVGLHLIGLPFFCAHHVGDQLMNSRHDFGVVRRIFFLQFLDLPQQPIMKEGLFRRDAGGHRAPGWSGIESIHQLLQDFRGELVKILGDSGAEDVLHGHLHQRGNQGSILGGIPGQRERGQQIVARVCRAVILQIPHGAQSGGLRDGFATGELGKQRGRARAQINAPITGHGCPGRLAHQFELIAVTVDEFAEPAGQFLTAPFIRKQIIAICLGQIRDYLEGPVI